MTKGSKPDNEGATPEEISRHAATERWQCYEIEAKYGWKLLRIEPTGDKILKYNCVFEGETEFPHYMED